MDLAAAEREVAVVPRDNGNGARSKSREPRSIPVSAGLIRLYADYLHGEYGDLDCDNTCSSTYGASRMAIRWATLPSTTWCGGCPDGHRLRPALVPAHGRHPVPTGAKLKDLMVSAGQSSERAPADLPALDGEAPAQAGSGHRRGGACPAP
jgi:hypothetical protein